MQPDLLAGISVAALVVPQGMSYAKLAGLPPVFGLYGAFVPVLVYSALGSSKHLVTLSKALVVVTCLFAVKLLLHSVTLLPGMLSFSCELWSGGGVLVESALE